MRLSTHEVIVPDMVGVLRGQSHDPSLSHERPSVFACGTFSPSRRQIRSTRSLPTCQGLNMRNAITVSELLLASVVISDVTAAQTSAPQITITPTAAQNVITGPKRFTGFVRVQSLFDPTEPSRTSGGAVTFQPGANLHMPANTITHFNGEIKRRTISLTGFSETTRASCPDRAKRLRYVNWRKNKSPTHSAISVSSHMDV